MPKKGGCYGSDRPEIVALRGCMEADFPMTRFQGATDTEISITKVNQAKTKKEDMDAHDDH